MSDPSTTDLQLHFERWVAKCWHKSYRPTLKLKSAQRVYENFDMQQAWLNWKSGYLAGRRSRG